MNKRRTVRDLRRRGPVRVASIRILIVSEGEKTEGIYFSLFKRALRASNIDIDILGKECGPDPLTVVEFAADKFRREKEYDSCYCVIDRDEHDDRRFGEAVNRSNATNGLYSNRSFSLIVSDPCFEYWFLLHYLYTRAPFARKGKKSRGDCVLDDLKAYLPKYEKSSAEEIEKLLPLTETAISNAKKALSDSVTTGEPNPSTTVHLMIQKIREQIQPAQG